MDIEKVAVIGAGVMGASIAAHISNAGIAVTLLDITPENATNRSIVAETAIQKLLKAEPAPFMHKNNARLITTGNIEDHLQWLANADWVIEAVIEHPQIKKSLYQQLESVCRKDCLISSNTSTLPLSLLVADLPDSFKERFMITHFLIRLATCACWSWLVASKQGLSLSLPLAALLISSAAKNAWYL